MPTPLSRRGLSFTAFFLTLFCLLISPAVQAQSPITVNDTDSGITYVGTNWQYSAGRGFGDYQNDVHQTTSNGAGLSYTFTGTGISYIGETNSDEGSVEVYLDGVHQTFLNCITSTRQVQQTLWTQSGLASGSHTLYLVKRSGGFMVVDAFRYTPSAPAPNFSVSASPTSLSVGQGASGTTTVSLTSTGGFTGSVALTASGLPTGVTAAFAPTSLSGTSTSALTLTAGATAAVGTATVTITGTSGTLVHTATVALTVTANPILTSIVVSPSTATLTTGGTQTFTASAKDQNGTALSPQPTFTWTSTGVGMITTGGVYSAGSSAGSATVKATNGTVSGTAAVTVSSTSSVSLSSLTLNMSSLQAGNTCSGAVQITGSSSTPVTINLAST